MQEKLIKKGLIPLDKYWMIRMGVLDMLKGYKDINIFLSNQKNLGNDLLALRRISEIWNSQKPLDVGESGTLYRYLKFASWKLKLDKKFIKRGTLLHRKICNNSKIIYWKLKKLLTLDGGTSQWASASVLLGNTEKIKNPPYFLQITLEALKHWEEKRKKGKKWEAKYDDILLKQAIYFINILRSKNSAFTPTNPDDYCFARAFRIVSRKYGEKRWPMIKHHESNRLEEMELALLQAEKNKVISSTDHRVVQAIAMLYKTEGKKVKFKYPKSVNKSWPQFWNFLIPISSFTLLNRHTQRLENPRASCRSRDNCLQSNCRPSKKDIGHKGRPPDFYQSFPRKKCTVHCLHIFFSTPLGSLLYALSNTPKRPHS